MLNRPSLDQYYLQIAKIAASRSSCISRQVGCVLVNNRNRVMTIGYNGPPSGIDHCGSCKRKEMKSGEGLDICPAVHAEQSALIECYDVYQIQTVYCTTAPCFFCIKLLLNTSCQKIVFIEDYPHEISKEMWLSSRREWIHEPL